MKRFFSLTLTLLAWAAPWLTCILQSAPALASDTYIRTDGNEVGQGIFRQRGGECLVITPLHVVDNAVQIEVTLADKRRFGAEVVESFPGDLAVLRLDHADAMPCRKPPMTATGDLDDLLASAQSGELRLLLADGSTRIQPVTIAGYDKYRYIQVTAQEAGTGFAKGESGSPLYIDGRFAGILLSVKNNVGIIARSDAIAQTMTLFFGDMTAQAAGSGSKPPPPKPAAAEPAKTPKEAGNSSTAATPPPPKSLQFSGMIVNSAVQQHTFQLEANSPVRLSFVPTGDREQFNVELLDSARRVIFQNQKGPIVASEPASFPFTPPRNDVYTLYVMGVKGEGKYAGTITPITANAQLRNDSNAIQIGGPAVQGILARGAVAEYRVQLEANSPIRFLLPNVDADLRYQVDIVDERGRSVFADASRTFAGGEEVSFPFTPPKSGAHLLRLKGADGEGRYTLQLQPITNNAHLRGEGNNLALGGEPQRAIIAQGAVAEYRIPLEGLHPIRFTLAGQEGKGSFTMEVVNSRGVAVYVNPSRRYSCQDEYTIPFTAPAQDTYTLRLVGAAGEGCFTIAAQNAGRP